MPECLLGRGSNVGDRARQLDLAIQHLRGCPRVVWRAASGYHQTRPVGGPAGQADFLNAAVRVATDLRPPQVLAWVKHVEQELGRAPSERWGPRSIDIDVLLYDLLVMSTNDLVVPHPRMAVRRFVLEPACEIGRASCRERV